MADKSDLIHNAQIVEALALGLQQGQVVDSIPKLVKRIIKEDRWQERFIVQTGEVVQFNTFREFVETPPLAGLGRTMRFLRMLCSEDQEAMQLLNTTVPEIGNHGANQHTPGRYDITSSVRGASTEYTLSRLKRDNPDLAQAVIDGKMSASQAAEQAGFQKLRRAIRMDNAESAARTIIKYMAPVDMAELVELLIEYLNQEDLD